MGCKESSERRRSAASDREEKIMFNLFSEQDENKFTWESIGDVIDGRRNLGENMPVFVYRLFQFTIKDELAKRYGNEATAVSYTHLNHAVRNDPGRRRNPADGRPVRH